MINGIKMVSLYNKELSMVSEYSGTGFASTSGTALLDVGESSDG